MHYLLCVAINIMNKWQFLTLITQQLSSSWDGRPWPQ